jgi:hypothetical protein
MPIKLSELIKQLQELEAAGAANMSVFASVGASKAKYEVFSGPYITNQADDGGPFNLAGADYVCINTGN